MATCQREERALGDAPETALGLLYLHGALEKSHISAADEEIDNLAPIDPEMINHRMIGHRTGISDVDRGVLRKAVRKPNCELRSRRTE